MYKMSIFTVSIKFKPTRFYTKATKAGSHALTLLFMLVDAAVTNQILMGTEHYYGEFDNCF